MKLNRRALLDSSPSGRSLNPIVITGDIHSNWANDLLVEFR